MLTLDEPGKPKALARGMQSFLCHLFTKDLEIRCSMDHLALFLHHFFKAHEILSYNLGTVLAKQ